MALDSSPSSAPKQRGIKIRRFVKRVTSFASIRPNARDTRASVDSKVEAFEEQQDHTTSPHSPPQNEHDTLHEGIPENSLPLPPPILKSFSSSSSATATNRTPQLVVPEIRRDDDGDSLRSGELSDSQESSFSGLSALASASEPQSVGSSPLQQRRPLFESSLLTANRWTASDHVEHVADAGARIDSCVIPAGDDLAHVLNVPIHVDADDDERSTPQPEERPASSEPTSHEPVVGEVELDQSNVVTLAVPSQAAADVHFEDALDAIPALEALTQLDAAFGTDPSANILCPVEDQFENFSADEAVASNTNVVQEPIVSDESDEESPRSAEHDLPLPSKPTLPAFAEDSSGADPEYLELDTHGADVYTVGQPDAISDAAVHDMSTTEQVMVESFAMALPLESTLAADVQAGEATVDLVFSASETSSSSVSQGSSPDTAASSTSPSTPAQEEEPADILLHADERPGIEACPPVELEAFVRAELPSSLPSEASLPLEEPPTFAFNVDSNNVESEYLPERPVIERCPPHEIEQLICADIPSVPTSVYTTEAPTPVRDVSPLPVSEPLEEPDVVDTTDVSVERPGTLLSEEVEEQIIADIAAIPPAVTPVSMGESDKQEASEVPLPETADVSAESVPESEGVPVSAVAETDAPMLAAPILMDEIVEQEAHEVPLPETVDASGESVTASEDVPVSAVAEADVPILAARISTGGLDEHKEPEVPLPETANASEEPVLASESAVAETDVPVLAAYEETVQRSPESMSPHELPVPSTDSQEEIHQEEIDFCHIEERPVLDRYPSGDDNLAVAAIVMDMPPLEDSEVADVLLSPDSDSGSQSDNDNDDEDHRDLVSSSSNSFVNGESLETMAPPASHNQDSSLNDKGETEQAEDHDSDNIVSDLLDADLCAPQDLPDQSAPLDNSAALLQESVHDLPMDHDHDIPELIPSIPTSSNSSEYGDELEDPPYPSTLTVPTTLPIPTTKHLPVAVRSVHLSLGYSLTWWLSKHPMF